MPTEFLQAAGLDASAIDENRAGRLTPSQAQTVLGEQRGVETRYLAMAVMMVVVVAIGAIRGMRDLPPSARLLGIAGLLGGPILVVLLTKSMSSTVKRDVSEGRVLSIDGPAARSMYQSRRSATYYLEVGGQSLKINRAAYHAFDPSARTYRGYYLPRTSKLVNLEILS